MSKPLDVKSATAAVAHFESLLDSGALDSRQDAAHVRVLRSLLVDYERLRNLPREELEPEMCDDCTESGIDRGSNFCSRCGTPL